MHGVNGDFIKQEREIKRDQERERFIEKDQERDLEREKESTAECTRPTQHPYSLIPWHDNVCRCV